MKLSYNVVFKISNISYWKEKPLQKIDFYASILKMVEKKGKFCNNSFSWTRLCNILFAQKQKLLKISAILVEWYGYTNCYSSCHFKKWAHLSHLNRPQNWFSIQSHLQGKQSAKDKYTKEKKGQQKLPWNCFQNNHFS